MNKYSSQDGVDLMVTCSAACPVHTDTREYVQCISRGDYEKALDVLLDVNPFPSVCGRICHHPCESECRRKEIDSPVSLRLLKRFVVENTKEYRLTRRKKIEISKEQKIAVIGAGPSGLTAARDLAAQGFQVVVFEKDSKPGGMLAHAIPRYRLPADALQEDIDDITAMGVEIRTGCAVGEDISFEKLRDDFDAILIAVGLSESHSLPIPGMDSDGVLLGIPFLWGAARGEAPATGEKTLIIGGGNVAIDTARTAKRLRPFGKVFLACLESRDEMPAHEWEIEEAGDEGIEILNSWGPKAILNEGGKVTGIEFRKCVRVFDEQGRFSPKYDESETKVVEVDSVIVTIGQKSNLDCLEGSAVEMDRGRLTWDSGSMATTLEGVFCCGEVATGPGSAIDAVATGHKVAKVIAHYVETGKALTIIEEPAATIGCLPSETAKKARLFARIEVELTDPAERIKDFEPIEPGFTEPMALAEARRCLACATGAQLMVDAECAGCLTCVRICPYGVATVDRTAVMPVDQCQTCGLCAAECPAAAIALARFATNGMKDEISKVLEGVEADAVARPFIVSYCCLSETTSRKFLKKQTIEEITKTGILRVLVPCVGRLSAVDLITPFELGADAVAVIACKEESCFYEGADELIEKRVYQAKRFIDEIGVGMRCLQFYQSTGRAEDSWPAIWEELKSRAAKVTA